jgi:hypothetical protein
MFRLRALGLGLLVLALPALVACDEDEPAAPPASPTAQAVCLEGGGFGSTGDLTVAGAGQTTAAAVGTLRWGDHAGCERVVIDLVQANGAPADGAGTVRAQLLRDQGVVRVFLDPRVNATRQTETSFGAELAEEAYVVRGLNARLFVDVHLAATAEARVLTLASPARIIIDLKPGGAPIGRPAEHRLVKVLAPPAGRATYPLRIKGYSRTFEANVVGRLQQGQTVVQQVTTAADWVDTWGQFSLTIDAGPRGAADLFVGDFSPADGSEQGVHLQMTMQ